MDIVKIQDLEAINASDDLLMLVEQPNGTIGKKLTLGQLEAFFKRPQYWTAITQDAFGASNIYALTYGNGRFVAGGAGGKMAYSLDGVSWTAITQDAFGATRISVLTYGNGRFVAGGDGGKMAYNF